MFSDKIIDLETITVAMAKNVLEYYLENFLSVISTKLYRTYKSKYLKWHFSVLCLIYSDYPRRVEQTIVFILLFFQQQKKMLAVSNHRQHVNTEHLLITLCPSVDLVV